ncbi:acyltransferase family protein [Leucobacter sp. gxy201]|uniref:acyltransferase family protein n=1 Tax=Leucobacter sp. gxy201 TaxID=2957200 RepID=UPI003DA15F6D
MPDRATSQHIATARFGGLDGLRAVAVGLVLVYHLWPTLLPGGFLGVDVFFAISGFLITSLLLRELDARGRIGLINFWRRRARRLLPALALVLLVCTSLARLVGGDILVSIGKQIAGASFFVSNWVYIVLGADYFARDNPELYRNTWSLAIEEQFYIVLPLLLLLLFRMRGRWSRAAVLLGLGSASAAWMAIMSMLGADATRIYFGSDTHTFGLLLGAGAAALLHRSPDAPPARRLGVMRQLGILAIALAGLAVLGWLAVDLDEASPESFQGGFQLATAAAIVVVCAITRPGAWAGRALDILPMRWVGERSYGIYLWHWPLLIVFGAAFAGALEPWVTGVFTFAVTIALAALSYSYVEQPIRSLGLRATLKKLCTFKISTRRNRTVAAVLAALLVVTVPATAYTIATAPSLSTAAEAIARGQAALDEQAEGAADGADTGADAASGADADAHACDSAGASAAKGDAQDAGDQKQSDAGAGTRSADAESTHAKSTDAKSSDSKDTDAKRSAEECRKALPPVAPQGADISAIGDSVMLASLPELTEAFPGIAIDAAVSRGMGPGVGLAQQEADQGALRSVVVVGLGTNGTVDPEELEELHRLAGTRLIVLVNAYGERDWIPGVNQTLESFAASYRGVVVADWQGSVTGVEGALAGDDIHPNPSGGAIYAASVQQALDALQQPGEALGYAIPRR